MSAKISVVAPIYNVEEYLPRCLDSITGQTYRNLEIMLIDDGSPDGAGVICDEYAERDERIRVFHIPNGGVAKARQLGVESSTGEYIVFVDPDDWLPLDSVENLYTAMSEEVDVVIGGHTRFYSSNDMTIVEKRSPRTYIGIDYVRHLLLGDITTAPWAKLFKRGLFTENSFPATKRGQDFLMNIYLACRCEQVVEVADNVYQYRAESGSSSINSFALTFEYCQNHCAEIKNALQQAHIFSELQFEYAITALGFVFNVIKAGEKLDKNDPIISSIKMQLKGKKLNLATMIMRCSLDCGTLRFMIRSIYKNIRSGRSLKLRKLIKVILNR